MIIAAADGSSLANPGPTGWAWVVDADRWAAGGWPQGTNNMGELMAVLDLLRQTRASGEELQVLCDSQYVINTCTRWIPAWKSRGWRRSNNQPVLNLELVQALDAALKSRAVSFTWVKGHAGHPLNEAADRRARAAATAFQQGRAPDPGPGWPLAAGAVAVPEAVATAYPSPSPASTRPIPATPRGSQPSLFD